MIMLYAVRMRLVFISSVMGMRPLRMISVVTASAVLDPQVSKLVHGEGSARRDHGSGPMLFDERRPLDAIARLERRPRKHPRVDETVAGEVDRTRRTPGHRAFCHLGQNRLGELADDRDPQAHDLGALVGRRVAVALLVCG